MRQLIATALLALLTACSDVASSSDATLVVRGKVMTGARNHSPVAGGFVRVLEPQGPGGGHWTGLDFGAESEVPNKAVTNDDGSYTFTIDLADLALPRLSPVFLAASDAAQTMTLLAELPVDSLTRGALLTIDLTPTSTAASQLICPSGVFLPPVNSWCSSASSGAAAANATLMGIIDGALAGTLSGLDTGSPPNWSAFVGGLLNDGGTFTQIKATLINQGIGFSAATSASITAAIATLPLVSAPDNNDANESTTSNYDSCEMTWDCGGADACIDSYGADTGSRSETDAAACELECIDSNCSCNGC